LEDKSDLLTPQLRLGAIAKLTDVLTVNLVVSLVRMVEEANNVHQARFAVLLSGLFYNPAFADPPVLATTPSSATGPSPAASV